MKKHFLEVYKIYYKEIIYKKNIYIFIPPKTTSYEIQCSGKKVIIEIYEEDNKIFKQYSENGICRISRTFKYKVKYKIKIQTTIRQILKFKIETSTKHEIYKKHFTINVEF
ncbi:hypothetical protein [Clostridium botulinum]|uniref:hypothetical protein n=1 Tax=Clostridium botulinum TaxID=1491 RepID=UPI001146E304|nr:hypothetical protein [Clostridium botulinum]QPW61359.1 hypothetical protein IG390_04080 [Clostridium botulinum]